VEFWLNALLRVYRPQYSIRLYRRQDTYNLVDCAVAKPLRADLVKPEIIGVGAIKGVAEARPGIKLQKCGRTSGLTKGTLQYVDVTSTIDVGDNRQAIYEDQLMATAISKGGDSGSLVLDEYNRAVGLLFAGSDKYTLCNRIQNVLDALNVRF
ncbi:MAG: S1 family peptidase, partial [Firmicutes bacterium]|nr:S1 family peptidase [Bacillota bacterium]